MRRVIEAQAFTITPGVAYVSNPLQYVESSESIVNYTNSHVKLLSRHRNVYKFEFNPVDGNSPKMVLTFPRRSTNRREKRRNRKRLRTR